MGKTLKISQKFHMRSRATTFISNKTPKHLEQIAKDPMLMCPFVWKIFDFQIYPKPLDTLYTGSAKKKEHPL
jgi:hypothetical protein